MSYKTYQVTVDEEKTVWRQDGKCHREDGPAVEYEDNRSSEYWLKDVRYETEADWRAALNGDTCVGKVVTIDGKKYKLSAV